MEDKHTDYFLRRISRTDVNNPFITAEEEFNTPSKTLKEFAREDKGCYKDGVFITYVFGGENTILGIARMRPVSFDEFKEELLGKKIFNLEELEDYADVQVIYMSRTGVLKEVDGLGFGAMLRSFLDGHARYVFNHIILYAYINEKMY